MLLAAAKQTMGVPDVSSAVKNFTPVVTFMLAVGA